MLLWGHQGIFSTVLCCFVFLCVVQCVAQLRHGDRQWRVEAFTKTCRQRTRTERSLQWVEPWLVLEIGPFFEDMMNNKLLSQIICVDVCLYVWEDVVALLWGVRKLGDLMHQREKLLLGLLWYGFIFYFFISCSMALPITQQHCKVLRLQDYNVPWLQLWQS